MRPIKKEFYSIEWDGENRWIVVKFFHRFSFEVAVEFKADCKRISRFVKSPKVGESRVRVLHDLTDVSPKYVLDIRTRAFLIDTIDYVDVMATFGAKGRVRSASLELFNIIAFLTTGKRIRFFETREEAVAWLRDMG